jgi:uncharacterized membrane protein YeaQ/YmgE (transglycosylase-associated protein family)
MSSKVVGMSMKLDRSISRVRIGPMVAATVVLIGVLAPPGAAQRRPPGMFQEKFEPRVLVEPYSGSGVSFEWDSEREEHGGISARIVAGTVGAIAGLYLGCYAGIVCNCGEDPGLADSLTGAVVGSGVMSALAIGLAIDDGRGLGRSLGKHLLISGAVLGFAHGTGVWGVLPFAPVLHVVFAVE